MKILCITVGKKHDTHYSDAIAEFEKRLQNFCEFNWLLVPTSDKSRESAAIARQFKRDDVVVLLDERGQQYSNTQVAHKIEQLQNNGTKRLVIVIGGAYGVEQHIRARSRHVVALSTLVFPHQLVRLIVIEQLYRSYSILVDGKYHHQ